MDEPSETDGEEPEFYERMVEFAERTGVTRQAVNNWIAMRMIDGDALVLVDGRRRIAVRKAMAQLLERRNPDRVATHGKARITLEGLRPRVYGAPGARSLSRA